MRRSLAAALSLILFLGTTPGWTSLVSPSAYDPDIDEFAVQPLELEATPDPNADPVYRAGVWTDDSLLALGDFQSAEVAAVASSAVPDPELDATFAEEGGSSFVIGDPKAGPGFPWEGNGPAGGSPAIHSHVVTNTGNRFTAVPILNYPVKGGRLDLDITLYHNSMGQYGTVFGKNWGCQYDASLIRSVGINGNPDYFLLRWGDGQTVPFTKETNASNYNAPKGVFLSLANISGANATVVTPDQTKYVFVAGFLREVRDRCNFVVTVNRDPANGRINTIDSGDGRSVTFNYNTQGLVSSITDPVNRIWSFGYNLSRLSSIGYPVEVASYTRQFEYTNPSFPNAITKETDLRGNGWQANYDNAGRFSWAQAPTAGQSNRLLYTYPTTYITRYQLPETVIRQAAIYQHEYSGGRFYKAIDPNGFQVVTEPNAFNLFQMVKLGWVESGVSKTASWQVAYDMTNGQPITITDPLNRITSVIYNAFADPTSVTQTPNDSSGLLTTTYGYTSDGNLQDVWDNESRLLLHNTYRTDKLLETTRDGATTDTRAVTTTFDYDSYGNVTSVATPSGTDQYHYDNLSRLDWVKDALLRKTEYAFDGRGRLKTITRPDFYTVGFTYDKEDALLKKITDELLRETEFTYDMSQRLWKSTSARVDLDTGLHDQEVYTYDHNDWLWKVKNGKGKTRIYTYSKRGDLTKLLMPTNAYEMWSAGPAVGMVGAYQHLRAQGVSTGPVINYKRDLSLKLTDIDYPTGTIATDTHFGFDGHGRLTSMSDVMGTSSWTYNGSRLESFTSPQGSLTYHYYDCGRLKDYVQSPTWTVTYDYDTSGRLKSIVGPIGTTSLYYNADDTLNRVTKPNSLWTRYEYDGRARVSKITHKRQDFDLLGEETYAYNAVDDLISKDMGGVVHSYGYDEVHQLTSEIRPGHEIGYKYDENGNRELLTDLVNGTNTYTTSYGYDDDDRITTAGAFAYTYDTLLRPTQISNGTWTRNLTWDVEDRLVGLNVVGGATASYGYNGAGSRVRRTVNGAAKNYLRAGADVLSPVLAEGSTKITPGIGLGSGTTKRTFAYDRLGSIQGETDNSGVLASTNSYDAFGSLISSSPRQGNAPFGFAGGWGYLEDDEASLKCVGHRIYDASAGRFLTPDHQYEGRNWFDYCGNAPTAYVDPTGEIPVFLILGAIIIIGALSTEDAEAPTHQLSAAELAAHRHSLGTWKEGVAKSTAAGMVAGPLAGKAIGAAGKAISAARSARVAAKADELVTVSRWGREGLEAGDWVMKGPATKLNYIKSAKWQPGAGNRFAPYSSGTQYQVPKSSLQWPKGFRVDGIWKGFFGQRIYKP